MKTMTVFEARNHFARTLKAARRDVVIVTRNGRPVAAIRGIGDEDIEDMLLEQSDRFWDMIARARRGKPIAFDALRREVRRQGARRPAGAGGTGRSGRRRVSRRPAGAAGDPTRGGSARARGLS